MRVTELLSKRMNSLTLGKVHVCIGFFLTARVTAGAEPDIQAAQ